MAWYDEAIFYHIYPLGLCGAPKQNDYGTPVARLRGMKPWLDHIRRIGCNALYIGPLFESVGHGYETTDYKKLDSRLGTNEDLKDFVNTCHEKGLHVIFDGVFNHTGRDFFAFRDIKQYRENSRYRDWYCNVNFWGNNEYNDGFSYENWGGYNLLVKLNQQNPEVRDYICDVIRFWVSEFQVDGIRLDAADVLSFDYMQALRRVANEVKPDFWLMGEVIHGDYTRWVNEGTLHSVTNYHLHKALYSGHNDHNYFEIAHTVKRLYDMGGSRPDGFRLYNFTDNHDVERIYTKLHKKEHYAPTHILLYTLPGIPSIYYGSEFGLEGKKEWDSDASLRPALELGDFEGAYSENECTKLIVRLGAVRKTWRALSYGDYQQLFLTNRQYAFSRNHEGVSVVVTVNNDDNEFVMTIPAGNSAEYIGALSGERVAVQNGMITVTVRANSGDIWVPYTEGMEKTGLTETKEQEELKRTDGAAGEQCAAAQKAEKEGVCMERRDKVNYYLDLAEVVSKRCTCLRRHYGAVIVKNDEVISTGYVGAPRGRRNCNDLGYCVRQQLNIPRGERYELCRSVHAEANAIISAEREKMIGSTLYLVGKEVGTGEYIEKSSSCSMCKRMVINAGISKVIIRDTENEYRVIDVQDWIENDESLEGSFGY